MEASSPDEDFFEEEVVVAPEASAPLGQVAVRPPEVMYPPSEPDVDDINDSAKRWRL